MAALDQALTNEGWLEGGPTRAWNRNFIELKTVEVQRRWNIEPFVVPAEEVIWDTRTGRTGDAVRARLPDVTCLGLFLSADGRRRCSVIWFQDDWAPPIDGGVLGILRTTASDVVAEVGRYDD